MHVCMHVECMNVRQHVCIHARIDMKTNVCTYA